MERMGMIEMGDAPVAVAQVPTALNTSYLTRQEAARAACEAAGITWPKTILPPGTALYDSGVERLRSNRRAIARKPLASTALPLVTEKLMAEGRKDIYTSADQLRLRSDNGRLVSAGNETLAGLGYDGNAWRQVMAQIPCPKVTGFAGSVLALDSDERAIVFNRRAPRATADIVLRTKKLDDDARIVRACLTSKYAAGEEGAKYGDIDIARALSAALATDPSARLDYIPGDEHSKFEVLWPSEIPIETFKVGDVHNAIIQVLNSETGAGALRIRPGVVTAACANLTLAYGFGVEVKFTHVGRELVGKVKAALAQAAAQVEPLIGAITVAARTHIPGDATPESIFRKLAAKFGATKERENAWEGAFAARYSAQPTAWGIASAITDAAQTADGWWAQQKEEEIAAQVVAQQWVAITAHA